MASTLLNCRAFAQDLNLITLDPGHFHAALFQREMLPGVAKEAFVYAALGPDVVAHLSRVAGFNIRQENPTDWRLRVYIGPDYFQQLLDERRGQLVIMSGRNKGKIDRILSCVRAGLHVLADKPWIIEEQDLPKLREALDGADAGRVIVYDAMTQRFEITAIIQRELVADADVLGSRLAGTLDEPAVSIESLHYLCKEVGGVTNLRPPWFFDVSEQGEGLTDVGTHLVDMVQWILFPDQPVDWQSDIQVLRAARWPTVLSLAQYQRVTGETVPTRPGQAAASNGTVEYFCNNSVDYTLRGLHVRVQATWDFVAPPGKKDTERVVFHGSRARVEVRQDPDDEYVRQVYVLPASDSVRPVVRAAVQRRLAALTDEWPGLALEEQGSRLRIVIPEGLRTSHEEHFARVSQRFLQDVRDPASLPAWEKQCMLSKYWVTTRGVALARQHSFPPPNKHDQTRL